MSGADLERYDQRTQLSPREWGALQRRVGYLAKTSLIPEHFRGKPDELMVAFPRPRRQRVPTVGRHPLPGVRHQRQARLHGTNPGGVLLGEPRPRFAVFDISSTTNTDGDLPRCEMEDAR